MVQESKISAGSYEMNKFLFGGYEKDIITTLYGPGGSGKTNICMIVCVSQAKKGNKVMYIDTEGGFSPDRFRQIHNGEKKEADLALQNILLLKPTTFSEQEESFNTLLSNVKNGDVSLIIIDSMVMLYRLELGDAITSKDDARIHEVNRKLANQLRTLNEIARKQNIPILVTNQVYASFNQGEQSSIGQKEISMVGGDLLRYWSKCLIEIQNFRGRRRLILRKHRSLPEKVLDFEIVDSGIRKKGLF